MNVLLTITVGAGDGARSHRLSFGHGGHHPPEGPAWAPGPAPRPQSTAAAGHPRQYGYRRGFALLTVMGGVAEFERKVMLERQREGIAKAKTEGRYKGRKATARAKAEDIEALAANGASMGEIAEQLGIGKTSVHRVLKPNPPASSKPLSGRLHSNAADCESARDGLQ